MSKKKCKRNWCVVLIELLMKGALRATKSAERFALQGLHQLTDDVSLFLPNEDASLPFATYRCNAMQYNAIQCNTMQYNAICGCIYIMQCNAVHQWNKWRFVALLSKYIQIQHQLVVVSRFGISMRKIATGSGSSALRQFLLSHYLTTKSSVIAGLMQCAPPQQNLHGSSWSFFQRSASA